LEETKRRVRRGEKRGYRRYRVGGLKIQDDIGEKERGYRKRRKESKGSHMT